MPKNYIQKQAIDVIYLKKYYKKLTKFLVLLNIIAGLIISQIFMYNFYIAKKNYFLITSFGKLIEITPASNTSSTNQS